MRIAMVVLYNEKAFHYDFAQAEHVVVGENKGANLNIPKLGLEMNIAENDGVVSIEVFRDGETALLSTRFDSPVIVDRDKRIALFFSRRSVSSQSIFLPSNCIIDIGRDAAAA